MNLNQLINGVNFRYLSDIVIDTDTVHQSRNYFDKAIIFCKTDFLHILFKEISSHENSYVLISHLSDYSITKEIFLHKPKCIKKWFAQNVDYKHEDLIPIPIGLENHEGPSKGAYTNWEYWKEYNTSQEFIKENIIYNNFSLANHPSRHVWKNSLMSNGFLINEQVNYIEYINNLKSHTFITSPRGNGIDCHRTWEALYHGAIPIVQKHFIYDSFNIPVVQINHPNEITKEFIKKILKQKENGEFIVNKNVLTLKYWKEKIFIFK